MGSEGEDTEACGKLESADRHADVPLEWFGGVVRGGAAAVAVADGDVH